MNEQMIEDAKKDVEAADVFITGLAGQIKLNPLDYYQMEVALKLRSASTALLYLKKALEDVHESMNNNSA